MFLFIAELYSIVWMYHILLIHSPVDGHLDYFQLGAIMNNAGKHLCSMSLHGCLFSILLRSNTMSGSYGTFIFNFIRNYQPVLQSGYVNLLSY